MGSLSKKSDVAINNEHRDQGYDGEQLKIFKGHIEDYLNKNSTPTEVTQFIEKTKQDEALLISYLLGRKNKADIAWNTLLHYAKNRFIHYPDVFHSEIPDKLRFIFGEHLLGTLKNTDKFGRRIVFCDLAKWNPATLHIKDYLIAAVVAAERLWRRPEVIKNGVIYIENAEGFGIAHAKQHTVSHVIRLRDIFLYSYPVACKGIFALNMPYLFALLCRICKPMFPKKLQSRIFLYSANQNPTDLFDMASEEILPTFVGGKLPIEEAAEDISFYDNIDYKIC